MAKKRSHQNRGSTGGRDQREKKPTAREALGRARLWRWWPLPALVLLAVLVLLTVSPDRHPPAGFPARRAAAGDTTELGTLPAGTPVIFLTIDTLREDHLSRSGYPRETTPFLDSLAAESVYFTRCFSQSSWTLPAMLTLISSLPPPIFGICDGVAPVPRTGGRPMPSRGAQPMTREVFAADHVTIAEVFREQGYHTVGISTNGHLIKRQGFAQGFEEFNETHCMWGTAACALKAALEAIDAHCRSSNSEAQNLFLWVHIFDPHFDRAGSPPVYEPQPGYEELFGSDGPRDEVAATVADYDRKIRYADDQLRLFFAAIEERGVLERSLVVIAADHGEEFNEKGRWGHSKAVTNTLINVPLLFHLPGDRVAGRVVTDVARNLDVMPTILDLVGLPAPPAAEGISLRPALEGRSLPALLVYADTQRMGLDIRCLIDPALDRKIVMDARQQLVALHVFTGDFQEGNNLARENPSEAEGLARRLSEMVQAMQRRAITEQAPAEISEQERERLRGLGYIGG